MLILDILASRPRRCGLRRIYRLLCHPWRRKMKEEAGWQSPPLISPSLSPGHLAEDLTSGTGVSTMRPIRRPLRTMRMQLMRCWVHFITSSSRVLCLLLPSFCSFQRIEKHVLVPSQSRRNVTPVWPTDRKNDAYLPPSVQTQSHNLPNVAPVNMLTEPEPPKSWHFTKSHL